MRNIQVIDEAINTRYAIYAVTDDEFALLFPGKGQDVEFIEDVISRLGEERTGELMAPVWDRSIDPEIRGDRNTTNTLSRPARKEKVLRE